MTGLFGGEGKECTFIWGGTATSATFARGQVALKFSTRAQCASSRYLGRILGRRGKLCNDHVTQQNDHLTKARRVFDNRPDKKQEPPASLQSTSMHSILHKAAYKFCQIRSFMVASRPENLINNRSIPFVRSRKNRQTSTMNQNTKNFLDHTYTAPRAAKEDVGGPLAPAASIAAISANVKSAVPTDQYVSTRRRGRSGWGLTQTRDGEVLFDPGLVRARRHDDCALCEHPLEDDLCGRAADALCDAREHRVKCAAGKRRDRAAEQLVTKSSESGLGAVRKECVREAGVRFGNDTVFGRVREEVFVLCIIVRVEAYLRRHTVSLHAFEQRD